MRCPAQVLSILQAIFKAVNGATVDAKLSQLEALFLLKGEKMIEYYTRLSGSVSEGKDTEHAVSELKQKRALPRGLLSDFDVTVQAIMGSEGDC